MTADQVPERFYRLLYFSPRPEDDERVCVAVLIYDAGRAQLEFDEKLDKAHCFAPDYTKASLSFVLETVRDNASKAALEGKIPEFSPQFRLSSPRALRHAADDEVRSVLRHRYLLKPRPAEPKKREKGLGRNIDSFLAERLGVPFGSLRRQASADDLFGSAARELPEDLMPRPVSRALISESEVCLIDGVDLHVESSELLVHRVNRVAHTFWQYHKAQEILPSSRQRSIFRAALILDGERPEVEPALRWRQDYAVHQFEKDSEMVVKAGAPEQESRLLHALRNRNLLSE